MKTNKQFCEYIKSIVDGVINGGVAQMFIGNEWFDQTEPLNFINGCEYRLKPATIMVNGFEVPKPMSESPGYGNDYFMTNINDDSFYEEYSWSDDTYDNQWLQRNICHTTKEAAIAHAKAMLGINPYD